MRRRSRFALLLLMCVFILLQLVCPGFAQRRSAPARKNKHHFLLFMGGLKSLATVVLIKMKIVVAIAALVALVVFTMKYLLGAVAGLQDLPELFFKGNVQSQYPQHSSYQLIQQEPFYAQGYPTMIPWDHTSYQSYGNAWSKIGNGGRSLIDTDNLYSNYGKVLFNNRRRKKIQKNYLNINNVYA